MVEFRYQEAMYLHLGQKIYTAYCTHNEQGNAVSILSDAMTVLRQMGRVGLELWIDSNNGERRFLRQAMEEETAAQLGLGYCLQATEQRNNGLAKEQVNEQNIDVAWSETENLMRALRYAKYYAKTREKHE